jgi:hypothetical protein
VYNVTTQALNWTGMECNSGRCVNTNVSAFDFMGYTMNNPGADGTENWRYTVWVPMDNATSRVDWTRPDIYDELYNQSGDVWTPGKVYCD